MFFPFIFFTKSKTWQKVLSLILDKVIKSSLLLIGKKDPAYQASFESVANENDSFLDI